LLLTSYKTRLVDIFISFSECSFIGGVSGFLHFFKCNHNPLRDLYIFKQLSHLMMFICISVSLGVTLYVRLCFMVSKCRFKSLFLEHLK
jgi:hypothetical protein